ncbi:MAG: hypothetical protein V4616_11780 [Bacteroidota bacterium]
MKPENLYTAHCSSAKMVFPDAESCKNFLAAFNTELSGLLALYAFALLPSQTILLFRTTGETDWETYLRAQQLIKKDYKVFDEAGGMLLMSTLVKNKIAAFIRSYFPGGSITIAEVMQEDLPHALANTHLLPVKRGLCPAPSDWTFSSYNAYLSDKPTRLPREEVLELVDGTAAFVELHR